MYVRVYICYLYIFIYVYIMMITGIQLFYIKDKVPQIYFSPLTDAEAHEMYLGNYQDDYL